MNHHIRNALMVIMACCDTDTTDIRTTRIKHAIERITSTLDQLLPTPTPTDAPRLFTRPERQ